MTQSENELQAQLNRAAAAGADDGVGGCNVRRGATAAEGLCGRVVEPIAVLPSVGICEVRVIEDIEELGAELGVETFAQLPVLGNGEIEVLESGITEEVTSHISELP